MRALLRDLGLRWKMRGTTLPGVERATAGLAFAAVREGEPLGEADTEFEREGVDEGEGEEPMMGDDDAAVTGAAAVASIDEEEEAIAFAGTKNGMTDVALSGGGGSERRGRGRGTVHSEPSGGERVGV